MKRMDVAIAVVVQEKQVLICKRPAKAHLGGFWEFPGGKQEPGESIQQCVARELREELDIQTDILAALPIIEHDYPDRQVRLHPFLCAFKGGEPKPIGCEEVRWVSYTDLGQFTFPPANDVLIAQVVEHLSGDSKLD